MLPLYMQDEECPTILQMPTVIINKNQGMVAKSKGKSLETILPRLYEKTTESSRCIYITHMSL